MKVGVLNFRLSGSFSNEGQSSLLYSRHIKMLPDVGMVKTYPKCPEAGMNVDLGCYNVMKYIPFLVPEVFYWLIFNAIATTYVFRDTVHHSYISTSFVEALVLPLFLYILWSSSCMWNEHMYKHDSFWCDRGLCYGVKLTGYIFEQSHSKEQITMRCLHLNSLCQSHNRFGADKDE